MRHRRFAPTLREFAPTLFLAYLDVDALPGSLDRLPLWSARRPAPVRFRRRDFLDGTDRPLGDAVRDLVEARLGRRPTGPVHLLAQLRTFGWLFNPLAVYYCWTPDGRALDAIVLEVTNTPWGERHWYVLDAQRQHDHHDNRQGDARLAVPPHGRRLPDHLDGPRRRAAPAHRGRTRSHAVFDAELALRRTTIDRRRAVTVLVRYPMLPLRVSAGIYAQAARLFAARSSRVPASLTTAGKDQPMKSTTSAPGRLARPLPCNSSNGSPAAPLASSIPSGTRASATTPPRRLRLLIDVTVRGPRPACVLPHAARGQRRARRVVRRRLVGHRRPHGLPAPRAPEPGAHPTRTRTASTAGYDPSSIPSPDADARRQGPRRPQHPRPLRPRQRVLPTDARRHDDVLVRRVRSADAIRWPRRPRTSSTVWPTCSSSRPATACSRSAPAGAASPSTRRRTTAATSRRRRSRNASTSTRNGVSRTPDSRTA